MTNHIIDLIHTINTIKRQIREGLVQEHVVAGLLNDLITEVTLLRAQRTVDSFDYLADDEINEAYAQFILDTTVIIPVDPELNNWKKK